eukprot:2475224-Rhodomonas_salina.2
MLQSRLKQHPWRRQTGPQQRERHGVLQLAVWTSPERQHTSQVRVVCVQPPAPSSRAAQAKLQVSSGPGPHRRGPPSDSATWRVYSARNFNGETSASAFLTQTRTAAAAGEAVAANEGQAPEERMDRGLQVRAGVGVDEIVSVLDGSEHLVDDVGFPQPQAMEASQVSAANGQHHEGDQGQPH